MLGTMRALLAAALAIGLLVIGVVPHAHLTGHTGEECALCVARHGDVAQPETPDLTPGVPNVEAVVAEPVQAPVAGAPLGAIPGQSPPAAA